MGQFKRSYFFYILTFLICLHSFPSAAQVKKYFVYFTDKNSSPYSINNPSQFLSSRSVLRRAKQGIAFTTRDLPVNPNYIDSVKAKGASVSYTSRWFNAALVLADSMQMVAVKALPFVQSSSKLNRMASPSVLNGSQSAAGRASVSYGSSLNQIAMIGADLMHARGFHGEGMQIAVLDAGFKNANAISCFDTLFTYNQVLATYDFVSNNANVYDDDAHGTEVLSILAAYVEGQLIGPAYKAQYYLLRTEDAASEQIGEEFNWLAGAEYADSAGADIISSSLGYNTFDDPSTNHTYADMNGSTTIITRAANMAASAGIVVVNSAGNEGVLPWKYIIAPADSDSILAVGAVNASGNYAIFSSVGPSSSGHIKPDLVACGEGTVYCNSSNAITSGNGTSYACPLVAGLAAGVWQAYPYLTSSQIIDLLKRSGSQYCHPDNSLGYGIPDFTRVQEMIDPSFSRKTNIYPSPFRDEALSLILTPAQAGKEVTVKMFDLHGRLLDEQLIEKSCLTNKLTLNTYGLSQGIFLIQVICGSKRDVFRVVKY
jgi:serine protease AprX